MARTEMGKRHRRARRAQDRGGCHKMRETYRLIDPAVADGLWMMMKRNNN